MAKKKYPIWNEEMETMPREELEKVQLNRFQQTVDRVYSKVPFYKKLFDDAGLKPGDVKSWDDVAKIPFTVKQNLRDNYPFGPFAAPLEEVTQIHATSGTTGKMTVTGYTDNDMKVWAEVMARVYRAGGTKKGDVVHNAYGYGLFTGGLGFHLGAHELGATVVPVSGGLTSRQVTIMQDFGSTVLTCTPSYALVLAEAVEEAGLDPKKDLKLRIGFFGAEPWTDKMREEIERRLSLEAFDIFGLAEIIGPGVSVECPIHNGLHIAEDHFYPEIIEPETGESLPYGTPGELVFTTLTKEAFPLIRYRTRDRTVLHAEKCECGRTVVRMGKIMGRTDDMLIIRGVNVFPSQIEDVLLSFPELSPHYIIYVDRPKDMDVLTVEVEATERLFEKGWDTLKEEEGKVKKALAEALYVSSNVNIKEPFGIQRSQGKAVRVVDRREL
ncbi:MAG: AMP-binding protein [Anaerolineae bacterium]|nr:AMP-binding protein [Anaerolineae bacterium]NIN97250.1 AMP-binding protein [Anaerolineae bacterium]NIQ80647.1 AMP-binding protein [Anaerolineae bacterium]